MIGALAPMARRALLVERKWTTEEGRRILRQLDPWCVTAAPRSVWPGTRYFGSDVVVVREFTLSSQVVAALQTTVAGLYAWEGGLPEDLAFLREDGEALMFGISHEKDGCVLLHQAERDTLLPECPGIADVIEWRPGGPQGGS